jgi:hypothetical protein
VIFRRRKPDTPDSPESPDSASSADIDDLEVGDDATDPGAVADHEESDDDGGDAATDRWAEYDASRDWRDDGPFDIEEVDLDDDTVPRLDLGALIVTPAPEMELQIVADPETGQGMTLLAATGSSGIQVTLFAAPSSSGFAGDIAAEIIEETLRHGGTAERAEGPFGTELRRVVPAEDANGKQGMAPMRDWFAQGPRWLLNGRLMGQAAVDVSGKGEVEILDEFFRNLIVRRQGGAMVPGQVIGLTIPSSAT